MTFVTFAVSPKILNVQKEFVLKAGQPLELVMPFEAYPKPEVSVEMNGAPLTATTPHTLSVVDNTVHLKLPKVTRPEQCGVFNLQLTNPYGEDTVSVSVDILGKEINQFAVVGF